MITCDGTSCHVKALNSQDDSSIQKQNSETEHLGKLLFVPCLCHRLNNSYRSLFRTSDGFGAMIISFQSRSFSRKPDQRRELGAFCPTFIQTRWIYDRRTLNFILQHVVKTASLMETPKRGELYQWMYLADSEIRRSLRQDSGEDLWMSVVGQSSFYGLWQISLCGSIPHLAARRTWTRNPIKILGECWCHIEREWRETCCSRSNLSAAQSETWACTRGGKHQSLLRHILWRRSRKNGRPNWHHSKEVTIEKWIYLWEIATVWSS
jgi:hypothetical protein